MLERKDIKVGDLLVAIKEMSTRIHPKIGTLYIVCSPIGYGTNGIYVILSSIIFIYFFLEVLCK